MTNNCIHLLRMTFVAASGDVDYVTISVEIFIQNVLWFELAYIHLLRTRRRFDCVNICANIKHA